MCLKGIPLTTALILSFVSGCHCQGNTNATEDTTDAVQTSGQNKTVTIGLSVAGSCIGVALLYMIYRVYKYGPRKGLLCCKEDTFEETYREEFYENGKMKSRERTMKITGRTFFQHGQKNAGGNSNRPEIEMPNQLAITEH